MKVAVIAAILIACISTIGQTPTPSPEYSDSDANVKPSPSPTPALTGLSLSDLKARAKRLKVEGDLITYYDKFRDESHLLTKPRNVVGQAEGVGAIMAGGLFGGPGTPRLIMTSIRSIFKGDKLATTPDKFALTFDSMNASHMFLKGSRVLYVLYDGDNRLELESIAHDSDIGRGIFVGIRVEEKLAYLISREDLQKIANAKKVEFIVGGNDRPRKFGSDTLRSWRAILAVTEIP